jgi:hypothetical protein
MVPDATMEGASIAKKIGKGTYVCVCVCVLFDLGRWREGEGERERFTFSFVCRGGSVGHW